MGKVSRKALEYAVSKLGEKYSQSDRWNDNPYMRDCSSLVWSAYESAGYRMGEKETAISSTEVYDKGFSLLWPENYDILGEKFEDINNLKQCFYQPEAGDLIFFNTDKATARENKITHVAMVENKDKIIHARNSKDGICRNDISLYGKSVVAITRFKEDIPPEDSISPQYAKITGTSVNIRKEPNTNSEILAVASCSTPLIVASEAGIPDWLQVVTMVKNDKNNKFTSIVGYISRKYVELSI